MSDKLKEIMINIETTNMDEIIEKANKLVELLREAQQILNSLFGGTSRSET